MICDIVLSKLFKIAVEIWFLLSIINLFFLISRARIMKNDQTLEACPEPELRLVQVPSRVPSLRLMLWGAIREYIILWASYFRWRWVLLQGQMALSDAAKLELGCKNVPYSQLHISKENSLFVLCERNALMLIAALMVESLGSSPNLMCNIPEQGLWASYNSASASEC
jgi:hypothetical protein